MKTRSADWISTAAVGPSHRPLLLVLGAVGMGIVADRLAAPALAVWPLVWSGGLAAWGLLWWRGLPGGAAVCLLAAVAAAGGAWHHVQWRLFAADDLGSAAHRDARPLCAEVVALESARWQPAPPPDPMSSYPPQDSSRLRVQVESIRVHEGTASQWRPARGRATLTCSGRLTGIEAGDRLRVLGTFQAVSAADNPGQRSQADHARGRRELFRLRATHPEAVQFVGHEARVRRSAWQSGHFAARRLVQAVRDRGHALLQRHVGPARSELAAALLLGVRDQLPASRSQAFLLTGTMHVLAISGLHVGVLVCGVWWAARIGGLPRWTTLAATALFAIVYAVLTDLRPPVVRASLLVVAWCAARLLERRAGSLNTLAGAALLVLGLQPSALFETGAQLSFLAVGTLTCVVPDPGGGKPRDPIRQLILRTRPWPLQWARRGGSALYGIWARGVIVWLVSLPLVLERFHVFSVSGLALNVLIWLPLSVSLFAGLLTMVCGAVLPPLGAVWGRVCDLGLLGLEGSVQLAGAMPLGYRWLPGPPAWYLALFYLAWGIYLVRPRSRPPARWTVALLMVAALGSAVVSPAIRFCRYRLTSQPLTLTFISVGHGTSVLCEFPDGQALLYDAGSLGNPATAVNSISACLWSRGLLGLDQVVVSHADADHYNAVPGLLQRFWVGKLLTSSQTFGEPPPGIRALQRAVRESGVPSGLLVAGDHWWLGPDTRLEVLHPPPEGVPGSDNANSVVLLLHHQQRRVLLTGDLEAIGLERLLALPPLSCDVVLVPHHGSRHSRPRDVAQWARPQWLIVSGGQHADLATLRAVEAETGGRLRRTAEDGAIQVLLDRSRVVVRSWRETSGRHW